MSRAPRSAPTPSAELAFLTQPEAGSYLLNLKIRGKFQRVQITKDQLCNILSDGSQIIFRERSKEMEGVECRR